MVKRISSPGRFQAMSVFLDDSKYRQSMYVFSAHAKYSSTWSEVGFGIGYLKIGHPVGSSID